MKNIPEGATHTAPGGTYRMLLRGYWREYADGDWIIINSPAPHLYTPIKDEVVELNAPKAVEWYGIGLPPVGVECELKAKKSWELVKILAHVVDDPRFNPIAIYMPVNDPSAVVGQAVAGCFRPIRTAEQVAAEEREKAAIDLAFVMTGHLDRSKDCYKSLGEIIYDAGYRKQVEK